MNLRENANSNTSDFLLWCINRSSACKTQKGNSLLCLVLLKPLLEYCSRLWALGSLLRNPHTNVRGIREELEVMKNMAYYSSWKFLDKLNDSCSESRVRCNL